MRKFGIRMIGILLVLVMLLGMMPTSVLAASWKWVNTEELVNEEVAFQEYGVENTQLTECFSAPYVVNTDGSFNYYGRNALSQMPNAEAYLYAYDQIVAGVAATSATINIYDGAHNITSNEVSMVLDTYRRDYAHHFWLANQYGVSSYSYTAVSIKPTYLLTGAALDQAKTEFETAVARVLAGITPDMTEYEKELYLHDTLARTVTYSESTHAHNAYGALVEGIAVCEGYAEAFQYLLHRVGIQSFIITGNAGGPHAWNMVRIDGNYYQVDLTWNDQDENLYHEYFNVTDAQIQKDHTADATAYTLPACTVTDAFYFTGKDTYLSTYTVEQVAKLLQDHDLKVHLYLPNGTDAFWSWFKTNINAILSATGVRSSCSYGYSCLQNELVLRITNLGAKVTNGNTVSFYSTAANGLRNIEENGQLKLLDDVTEDLSANQRILLDLNGHCINGSLSGNGITIFDSQTDDYTVNDGIGYGMVTGTVAGVSAAQGYIPITETAGVSYHKVDVSLDKLVLRAASAGLYYTGSFLYDEVVAKFVATRGVTMSTTNTLPVADNSDSGCLYTTSGNSVLLKNILSEGNSVKQNRENAKDPVYARAYLKLEDGTILYSDTNTANLQTLVETLDAQKWEKLTVSQRDTLIAMYQTYAEEMSSWDIPNLKNA